MADTYIHSIDAFSLNFAGIAIDNGGGDGGWVEVEFPQGFDAKTGVHGDVVTYKTANSITPVRITLLKESDYNRQLFEVYVADKLSESGAGIGSFILEDSNSGWEVSGDARIIQPPTYNIQAESQEGTWTLQLYHAIPAVRPRGSSISFGFGLDISASVGFSF